MNAKQVKKMRQIQRKMMPDIPAEVDEAIKKAFLTGVEVGWTKATVRFEEQAGTAWIYGGLHEPVNT